MLRSFHTKGFKEAGLDEAGRGCLAGPVVAAYVILPPDYSHPLLTDSKKLSKKLRETLREEIIKEAIEYHVSEVSSEVVDEINILNASFLAMHQALDNLKCRPDLLLIDGNRFKAYKNFHHECIVEGDSKFFSIAAASILAKTYRDDLMTKFAEEFPVYGWHTNMGYATKKHIAAIKEHGITPLHRKSFTLFSTQLDLFKNTP
ncbi:ribonuclease HII [Cytophagaceae bacterium ABcell3]|nr:ribonuclease HII [Cytophagaceae bacterium ABcell3]